MTTIINITNFIAKILKKRYDANKIIYFNCDKKNYYNSNYIIPKN